MRLLITGGAGFIGSNFVRHFLQTRPGASIVVLDKLTYAGNLENLAGLDSGSNYQFVRGDVAEREVVEQVLDGQVDAIVHFAAETHVDRSIADARDFVRTNVAGTYTLLEAARRRQVGRFVHVSTDEVYGSLEPSHRADEESRIQPNSPYAASKAAADMLVRSFWQTYRFPVITTRCSNNYGPYQFPEKLIPLMIANALEDKPLPIYGDGLNERDWIYVEDHCRALVRVLEAGVPGEVYNIGYGQPTANLEIVGRLLRILGKPESLIQFVADRPRHDRRYALNTGKIRSELGWQPAVTLEEGLKQTAAWYLKHPTWVEKNRSGEYRDYYDRFYGSRAARLANPSLP